jgi:ComEC/Rec2-related protein
MAASKLIIIILILFAPLGFRFYTYFQHVPTYADGQAIFLQAVLQENPELSNRGQSFMVKTPDNQRIYLQTNLSELYQYGDTLAIDGQLQVSKSEDGREFLHLYFPKIRVHKEVKNPLLEARSYIREKSFGLFEATLPPIASQLLLGIVFGAKGDFSDVFFEDLQTTGVLHVIAASGMNVSFFTGAVMFSLGRVVKRRIAIILSIFAVIFYSFLVGFEPSILRASVMAIIAFTASFLGRQNLALFALFLAGTGMLLWSPSFLFDVGFQLSFMATLGILLVNPRLKWFEKWSSFGEDVKTTLSAQIGTLPILLGTFGSVGVLSILVNVLILWTVPILMLLGTLGVVGGIMFAPLGKLFLLLSLPFLLLFEKVVSFFGSFNLNFTMETFPWALGVGYYLIIAALLLRFRNSEIKQT